MRYCLINPPWTFDSSIYFGCREPHLPLEYGYSKALLERAGHEVEIVDGQLDGASYGMVRDRVAAFRPDFTVITTAPSYLFWRCAPPELRVPRQGDRHRSRRLENDHRRGTPCIHHSARNAAQTRSRCRHPGGVRGDPAATGSQLARVAIDRMV